MVLIFSRSYCSTSASKHSKTSFRSSTRPSGVMPAAIGVKSTTSAKRMLASSNCSAMVRGPIFNGAEIEHEEPRDQVVGQARRREIRLDERADHQQDNEAHDPQHGLAQVLDQQR